MRALVDADILRYEVGFGSQGVDEDGNKFINSFEQVKSLLEHKLKVIQEESWSDEEPILYLTNDRRLHDRLQKRRVKKGLKALPYVPGFREAIAVSKPYKGNRKGDKPYHYDNLTAHIISSYNHKIATSIEADDLMSIDHRLDPENTIICSRDKDLRITPGNHYGWQCGKNLGFGPIEVDELGFLELKPDGKLFGAGLKFFYSQLLTGDSTDNIGGLPKYGPTKAFNLLVEAEDENDLFNIVSKEYENVIGDKWRTYFREQATLLWMIQELNEDGSPIHYKMFDEV